MVTRSSRLSANQHCALTAGTDTLTGVDYVIEGTASLVTDQATNVQLYRVQPGKGFRLRHR